MAYIWGDVMPNCVPVTLEKDSKKCCDLNFVIYKTPKLTKEQQDCQLPTTATTAKAPQIVVTATVAPMESITSQNALCCSNDIPSAGYSFVTPRHWTCFSKYDDISKKLSFVFLPHFQQGDDFEAATIQIKNFFTTAQAGTCMLDVQVEKFSLFLPDVVDSTFTIPVQKQHDSEILDFTANGSRENFFLHHSQPVLFQWNVIAQNGITLELLEDGNRYCSLSETTGTLQMDTRKENDHEYTLKMSLKYGEKTKSIVIKDTRWKKIGYAQGIQPNFTYQSRLQFFQNKAYVFYGENIYCSELNDQGIPQQWNLLCWYKGDVHYSDSASMVVCEGKIYLIGGKKENSREMFYSVYDIAENTGRWVDYDFGQEIGVMDGTATCQEVGDFWMVYLKQMEDTIFIFEYQPDWKMFVLTTLVTDDEPLRLAAVGLREGTLYLAFATSQWVIVKKYYREQYYPYMTLQSKQSPKWMQWVNGSNGMYLMTNEGIYHEERMECVESFQPPCEENAKPWYGWNGKEVVGLFQQESETEKPVLWTAEL